MTSTANLYVQCLDCFVVLYDESREKIKRFFKFPCPISKLALDVLPYILLISPNPSLLPLSSTSKDDVELVDELMYRMKHEKVTSPYNFFFVEGTNSKGPEWNYADGLVLRDIHGRALRRFIKGVDNSRSFEEQMLTMILMVSAYPKLMPYSETSLRDCRLAQNLNTLLSI